MPVGTVLSKQGHDLGPLINEHAAAFGLPTRPLTAQLLAESGLDEQAEHWGAWPDVSFGLSQPAVAWAPFGDQRRGPTWRNEVRNYPANVAAVRDFYFIPEHAIAECAKQLGGWWHQLSDLADEQRYYEAASRYNGGSEMAFADNPNQANIRQAWQRAAQYEVEETPVADAAYNPDAPVVLQRQSWTCSICTTTWLLNSLGIPVTSAQMQDAMAHLADSNEGLHDGQGRALANWLRDTFGLTVEQQYPITWEWLQERAGQGPIGIGAGQPFYHWVAVRAADADTLTLANPAPGWQGVGQTMTRAQFERFAPFAGLYMPVDAPQEIEEETPVDDTLLAYLKEAGRTAREEIEAVLAMPRLPKAAREKLQYGALPAAQTIERGGAEG